MASRVEERDKKDPVHVSVYESRHYGWILERSTESAEKARTKDENNMDVFPCRCAGGVEHLPGGQGEVLEVDIKGDHGLVPWEVNEVSLIKKGLRLELKKIN